MLWRSILVIGCKQPFVGQNHKSLVSQNCEYKSTLLRAIDEHLVSGNGVLMLNIHKLNITNKKIKTKKEIPIELLHQLDDDEFFYQCTLWMTMSVMTFLIVITCEWLWESKHDCQFHSRIKIDQFPRHPIFLKMVCKLCNADDLWNIDVNYE